MKIEPRLGEAPENPHSRISIGTDLPARPLYFDPPQLDPFEEPCPALLLECWYKLRPRKSTLLLIAFLGLLASLLLTLSQKPVYQARASLEIQNLNENFLNMRNVNPTANEVGSYRPDCELQTREFWHELQMGSFWC